MTAALEGGEWSAARPGRTLTPGKTRHPFYRRLGGLQGRSGQTENLVPTGIRSRTVQPVVIRYTDWASRPTFKYSCGVKCLTYPTDQVGQPQINPQINQPYSHPRTSLLLENSTVLQSLGTANLMSDVDWTASGILHYKHAFLLAAGSGHNETTSQSVPMATTRKFCRGRERSETGRR